MKTYQSKSGEIMAEFPVTHYISKYELEATIGNLLNHGKVVSSASVIKSELRELLRYFGPDFLNYYWDNNDKNILPACELIAQKYFPEFYK